LVLENSVAIHLQDDSDVYEKVQNRIYPLVMPPKVKLPALSYQRVASVHVGSVDGSSGLESVRSQIDAWGRTDREAKEVGEVTRLAMLRMSGTINGEVIRGVEHDGSQDFFESAPEIYRQSMDFVVWHEETKP